MIYDIIIIGAGPAGLTAAKHLSQKGLKILILDKGKMFNKRKDLICGWFGNGFSELSRIDIADKTYKESLDFLKEISKQKFLKKSLIANFSHNSSLKIAQHFYDNLHGNVDVSLDNEVLDFKQKDDLFLIKTEKKDFVCKKCILATGKFSIEFVKKLKSLIDIGLVNQNATTGIRVEVPIPKVKDYFAKHKGLDYKEDNICFQDFRMESVIAEWDDSNIISAFGSFSEEKTRKANFFIGIEEDIENCIRNTKIINVLNNDKVKKEFVKEFLSDRSIISDLKFYDPIKSAFIKLNDEIKGIVDCAMIHLPEIRLNGILNVDQSMKTNISNIYGIGECTNFSNNILGSIFSGKVVAETILKEKEIE
jgi:uncharacterized FAD-dependent dehydrogenase